MSAAVPLPGHIQRIVLTGFMGSGKTTVGLALARRLQWHFADLDETVAAAQGLSVPDIFAAKGEPAFREAEVSALRDLLQKPHLILALGGGAPETQTVRDLLAADRATAIVHLQAPFATLYARCVTQATDPRATARPLLGTRSAAEARYRRRLAIYSQLAHHTADASCSPEDVATQIVDLLLQQVPTA